MNRKNWTFCDQILEAVAILDKKLNIFIVFKTSILYSKNLFSIIMLHSDVAYRMKQIYINSQKVRVYQKIIAMNKISYFSMIMKLFGRVTKINFMFFFWWSLLQLARGHQSEARHNRNYQIFMWFRFCFAIIH